MLIDSPACWPTSPQPAVGSKVVATGFGYSGDGPFGLPRRLQELTVPVTDCKESLWPLEYFNASDDKICIQGKPGIEGGVPCSVGKGYHGSPKVVPRHVISPLFHSLAGREVSVKRKSRIRIKRGMKGPVK